MTTDISTRTSAHPLTPLIARMVGDEKHATSAAGTLHPIWVLYDRVLRIDPERPEAPERDRFLLSKGHGPMAYYAALAHRGYFSKTWLDDFLQYHGRLGGHPDRTLIPGVEVSSGSLGHGLPIAVGMALALRARGNLHSHIYCLIGDGELDEGSNHEAIAFAGRAGLSQLTVLIIDNQSSSHGWPQGIGRRFEVEGWQSIDVDGTDESALEQALAAEPRRAPHAVIAHVEKKGS